MLNHPNEVAAMKTAAVLVAASVLFVSSVLAQSKAPVSAPPPPGMHDPGVQAVGPAASAETPSTNAGAAADAKHMDIPEVRAHREGENLVQDYRRSGMLYMVVVTPKVGIPQTYMVDPQGRLLDEHGKKPMSPAMYKVIEWGKSKPASDDANAAGDSGH
jgi:hypothetical protein